jgi:hypothetical protein
MTVALFSFPDPVNEVSARLVAGGVVLMSVAAIVFGQPWVAAVLAYGFVARVLTGPTLSPLGQFATRIAAPRLGPPKYVPGPPKRFAQGMGAAITTTAAVLALALDATTAANALLAAIAVAAALESALAFCIGCQIFTLLIRTGVLPESVCLECAALDLNR